LLMLRRATSFLSKCAAHLVWPERRLRQFPGIESNHALPPAARAAWKIGGRAGFNGIALAPRPTPGKRRWGEGGFTMTHASPMHADDYSEQMLVCIQNCQDCHRACLQTLTYCMKQGGRHAEPEHLRLLMDCAD